MIYYNKSFLLFFLPCVTHNVGFGVPGFLVFELSLLLYVYKKKKRAKCRHCDSYLLVVHSNSKHLLWLGFKENMLVRKQFS